MSASQDDQRKKEEKEKQPLTAAFKMALESGTLDDIENTMQQLIDFAKKTSWDVFDLNIALITNLEIVARNPHVDVIEYVMKNGFGPESTERYGPRFFNSVCGLNSNPDVFTLFVTRGYMTENNIITVLRQVSRLQAYPAVVKRVFEEIVRVSGRSEIDVLKQSIYDHVDMTFLTSALEFNSHPEVILQILDCYPKTIRVEKYKEVKQKVESGDKDDTNLNENDLTLFLNALSARIDEGERQRSWWVNNMFVIIFSLLGIVTIAIIFFIRWIRRGRKKRVK
jgi:hypothetical protein